MRRFGSTVLAVLSASGLSGCGSLFFAQIEEPDLCKTVSVDFPASPPAGTSAQAVAVGLDLHSDLEPFNRSGTTSQLQLKYVEFFAGTGIADFGFVDAAKITLQSTSGASCNLADLVSYQRDPSSTPQATLTFTGPAAVDLMPCLSAGSASLRTDFSGRLPTTPWSMAAKACFSGKARIHYLGGK
ncbi:MAG TPA: hypothetical protein VEM39_00765 [Myxococcaceae bacterium]|nr:hypothetical protein [Myxococcaceae bacterium]